jgi:hypothetical protein
MFAILWEEKQEVKVKWLRQYTLKKHKKSWRKRQKLLECLERRIKEFWNSENKRNTVLSFKRLEKWKHNSPNGVYETENCDEYVVRSTLYSLHAQHEIFATTNNYLQTSNRNTDSKGSFFFYIDIRPQGLDNSRPFVWKSYWKSCVLRVPFPSVPSVFVHSGHCTSIQYISFGRAVRWDSLLSIM